MDKFIWFVLRNKFNTELAKMCVFRDHHHPHVLWRRLPGTH